MTATTPTVEIYWPASLSADPALDAVAELERAGLDVECRVQPVRRSADLSVVVLLCGSVVGPFLKTVFERLAGDTYAALQSWVQRLLGRERDGVGRAPASVIFESESTGAQFVFTPGLPDEAFRQALALDPGEEPGRWVWDPQERAWLRFEPRTGAPAREGTP
ncbi:hypothetical protein [Blastococcus saxobsidens]|uniref:Uncharacterized protein n=1 Tax=Blastococcus saxobsidens (strain DD2) TaxID=1146883 RepID=H6RJW9_BLASD|nr:hypothetical protein [Blastococcus saxobsidens]CCG03622.1 protein of unknown function [Blastococcus saxobsidens DD2]